MSAPLMLLLLLGLLVLFVSRRQQIYQAQASCCMTTALWSINHAVRHALHMQMLVGCWSSMAHTARVCMQHPGSVQGPAQIK
jgi:hypothetical protein